MQYSSRYCIFMSIQFSRYGAVGGPPDGFPSEGPPLDGTPPYGAPPYGGGQLP
jgi:hypothetical protein